MNDGTAFPALAQEWVAATAALAEMIGTERFPQALRQILSLGCSFDSMIVSRYEGAMPPESLYQDLDELQAAITVEFYASGPYLLDPLYQACRNGCAPGAYRLMDLAPEAFYRSEYYRAFYRKISISDEIGVLVPDGADSWFIVSLARFARAQRFEEADTKRLNAVFAVISAAIRRQWGQAKEPAGDFQREGWEDRMQTFGTGVLSPREREIVQLILQGHSTPSAAAYLGIAEGTVKVHRHHAYSKLGISSQAELFSMATRHLAGPG
ncbi:helix-turn-helix transcriptional regulator [Leisingera sp. ANG-Vp]|uniref:helix-turn-helix transcriptional regulator n=1 Tax=Leisingera sp. ANG-Vp TaxID=1577896 RepID=UPI00057FA5E2|nr:helix-turn-helix transcriptional regulator [Leisingera sp. ANG-Vp]KIC21131.1 DMSO reductase [Leisingera sp. ANG-Vp]